MKKNLDVFCKKRFSLVLTIPLSLNKQNSYLVKKEITYV